MHFKIRLLEGEKYHIVDKITAYHQIPKQTFLDMYFPKKHTYEFVDEKEAADICIVGIQHTDNSLLREPLNLKEPVCCLFSYLTKIDLPVNSDKE